MVSPSLSMSPSSPINIPLLSKDVIQEPPSVSIKEIWVFAKQGNFGINELLWYRGYYGKIHGCRQRPGVISTCWISTGETISKPWVIMEHKHVGNWNTKQRATDRGLEESSEILNPLVALIYNLSRYPPPMYNSYLHTLHPQQRWSMVLKQLLLLSEKIIMPIASYKEYQYNIINIA